jgi:hypothetical protein
MAFAARSSGELPATLPAAGFDSQISTELWCHGLALAFGYLDRLCAMRRDSLPELTNA